METNDGKRNPLPLEALTQQSEAAMVPQLPTEGVLYVAPGVANLNQFPQHRQLIHRIAEEWHPTDD